MASSITFCMDNPIKTDKKKWLFTYLGRVSVGLDKGDYYEILAYSDQESDFPELHKMARKNNARYINSVISEGVTTIE